MCSKQKRTKIGQERGGCPAMLSLSGISARQWPVRTCILLAMGADNISTNTRHLASRKTWSLVLILLGDWFCQKHPAKERETLGQCHSKVIMKSWEDSRFQDLSGPVSLIGWNLISAWYIHQVVAFNDSLWQKYAWFLPPSPAPLGLDLASLHSQLLRRPG